MFGELAVLYLFLGGAGAGCLVVASLLDLFVVKEPFGDADYAPEPLVHPLGRTVDLSFLVGFAFVAIGVACLVLDVGRFDRVLSLLVDPHPTLLTFGSYALSAAVLIGAALTLVRFAYLPLVPRGVVVAFEVAAAAVGLAVATYTGLLLSTLGGVRVWDTPFVPALFVLSSLSSGIALVVLSGVGETADAFMRATMRRLACVDLALIAAEGVCAAAFVIGAASSDHAGVVASYALLVEGPYANGWWIGFLACGLAVPFVAEGVYLVVSRKVGRAAIGDVARVVLLAAAAFVLVGALCMRWAIVGVGVHRDLELSTPEGAVEAAYADLALDARGALSAVAGKEEEK